MILIAAGINPNACFQCLSRSLVGLAKDGVQIACDCKLVQRDVFSYCWSVATGNLASLASSSSPAKASVSNSKDTAALRSCLMFATVRGWWRSVPLSHRVCGTVAVKRMTVPANHCHKWKNGLAKYLLCSSWRCNRTQSVQAE